MLKSAKQDRCILCRKPPYQGGIWFALPSLAGKLGGLPGEVTSFAYCLCRKCSSPLRRKETTDRVERKILAEVAELRTKN